MKSLVLIFFAVLPVRAQVVSVGDVAFQSLGNPVLRRRARAERGVWESGRLGQGVHGH